MADKIDSGAQVVTHDEKANRFKMSVAGETALLTYRILNGSIIFDHTEVPLAIEGQGIATQLTEAALEFARSKGLRVVPLCAFVADYIRKHAGYQDLLAPATLKRLLES